MLKQISMRVPKEFYETVSRLSELGKQEKSFIVREALKEGLEKLRVEKAISFKFSPNLGKIAENLVAIELKKREKRQNTEIFYWQNILKNEVDFVVKERQKVKQLIQVCWDISEYKTKEREVKALLKAGNELKCRNLLVITGDKEMEETIKNKKIKYLPIWKYLLLQYPNV